MLAKRLLRDQKLSSHLRPTSPTLIFFYAQPQLTAKQLQKLYFRFSRQGFCWYLFSRRWHPTFWPAHQLAYRFLATGHFYGLCWPSQALWQEATAFLPALGQPAFGLFQGHFFLQPEAPTLAPSLAPSLLCGSLHAAWHPLIQALSLLAVQLTVLLQTPAKEN